MKFLKIFLAALLAVIAGGILSTLFWIIALVGIAAGSSSGTESINANSILRIDLADNISDSPSTNPLANINFQTLESSRSFTLLETLTAIEAAKSDDRIKGIYLNYAGGGNVSTSAIEEIRAAIADFKQSGKFVVAYNEVYSQGGYYLASVADKIYIHPEGALSWTGTSSTLLFYKGALDKLGINSEIIRPTACRYKSAVEPYFLTSMSDANRRQMQALCDDIWTVIVDAVASSRNIAPATLRALANDLNVSFPEEALRHGLVDEIIYADQMEQKFLDLGVEKGWSIISLGNYCASCTPKSTSLSAPKVGIIYAEGQIVDGENANDGQTIYGTTLAETIDEARRDDKIKAVVLRVNSPGGSALASDVIWRSIELLRAEKPVIVSMSSYAASGGYYISCPADAILADELTLTGSIGVFGMLLEGGDMLRNKLGITTDSVKTAESADMDANVLGLMVRKFTPAERAMMMRSVDKVYDTFTSKVAAGRNLSKEKVLDIAEGRVWSGKQAVEIGLVDAIGGLKEAIAVAADKAGIADNFRITEVVDEPTGLMAVMQALNSKVSMMLLDGPTRSVVADYERIRRELSLSGVQAYCPYSVDL